LRGHDAEPPARGAEGPGREGRRLCDLNLELAEKRAAEHGGKAFKDAREMFDAVKLDAVFLNLPPFAHGAELEAVKRGIAFFVEKPINLYLGQAKEIAAAVAEKKIVTCAGYMNRYRKSVNRVRELVANDPVIFMTGGWIGASPKPREGVGIWTWWVQKDKSGGQFLEQVTHTVDLARFMGGDAAEVHAYKAAGFNKGTPANYSIEDASVVNIRFKGGAIANLWGACCANAGGGGVSLNVYAGNVTALFTGWEHSVRILQTGKPAEEIKEAREIFPTEDAAFLNAVRENDPTAVKSTYADAVKTLAISVAANMSMMSGRPEAVEA
jgi:predicted dehydrogenase